MATLCSTSSSCGLAGAATPLPAREGGGRGGCAGGGRGQRRRLPANAGWRGREGVLNRLRMVPAVPEVAAK